MIEGLLRRKSGRFKLIMIPESVKQMILTQYHSHALGGHMARDRLNDILKTRFYWRGMGD